MMIQQLLTHFTGTLNRRRAYAATHPMVREAEERLLMIVQSMLTTGEALSIGVARSELIINGTPYETKGSFARDLARRLHRRGVGAVQLEPAVTIEQLRAALSWLASDPESVTEKPPANGGLRITTLEYDHLVLDHEAGDGTAPIVSLWRSLADLAGQGIDARGRAGGASSDGDVDGIDTAAVLAELRTAVGDPAVARRAALALMHMASAGTQASPDVRARIGRQLHSTLERLGDGSFAPIIRSLTDRAVRRTFMTEVVDVLPVGAVVGWLSAAAAADAQQMSHHVLRLMTKMSSVTEELGDAESELSFRDAAQELVTGWDITDPSPTEHVELLDRIASFERTGHASEDAQANAVDAANHALAESVRLVQMALEIDCAGDDTQAAAEAMLSAGAGPQLMQYIASTPNRSTAAWLQGIATSEKAVRITLLSEPVDRLQARALLELLDASSASTLIDVLGESSTRGTRMIVRQRLAGFGEAIEPLLVARLEHAPWFLIRNILTVLQEIAAHRGGSASASAFMLELLTHEQAQVRIEALRVLLHDDGTRDAALRRALRDDAERVVLLAVQSLAEGADAGVRVPASMVAQLMNIVDAGVFGDSVRARAVRALSSVVRDDVRDWLVTLVAQRSRFLHRLTLAEPTQTAISAMQVLRRVYAEDTQVTQLEGLITRTASAARWLQKDGPGATERSA